AIRLAGFDLPQVTGSGATEDLDPVGEPGGPTDQPDEPAVAAGTGAGTDPQVVRVRQTALNRLLALAGSDPHFAAAARPVFVQALGDPNQAVRLQAFEHARAV